MDSKTLGKETQEGGVRCHCQLHCTTVLGCGQQGPRMENDADCIGGVGEQ